MDGGPTLDDAALSDAGDANDAATEDSGSPTSGGPETPPDAAPPEDANVYNPLLEDCDQPSLQLLLANGSFDRNDLDWEADGNAAKDWSAADSAGNSSSGSLTLTNKRIGSGTGLVAGGVSQCLEIPRNAGFQICADYLLDSASPGSAAVSVNLVLFDGEQCSGTLSTSPNFAAANDKGEWRTFKAQMSAPPEHSSYKSMLVKLVALKQTEDPPLDIQFDNVRIAAIPR
jgi:hypothetical protein